MEYLQSRRKRNALEIDRSDKAMADEIFITKNNQQVSKGGEANDDNENISSSKE